MKVQLSHENKISIDKIMLERYRQYKCCVFIDFEYMYCGTSCVLMCAKLKLRVQFAFFVELATNIWTIDVLVCEVYAIIVKFILKFANNYHETR